MQEHHIQKGILHKLVLSDTLRFADLRPKDIDSNVFTYHLKQLLKDKLVIKTADGFYSLTPLGRVAGINVTLNKKELLEQAHSVFFLCLKTAEEGWLLRKRLAQPMFEKIGFVHAEPVASEPAIQTAQHVFVERTGLLCDFYPRGTGYVRFFRGDDLESFVHFTLFYADSFKGELKRRTRNGENAWYKAPDLSGTDMIPSMQDLVHELERTVDIFYTDLRYQIEDAA